MAAERGNVDALIAAVAAGKTIAEAAALAEMGERTAYRRLDDPEVQRRIRETRAAMFERASGQLAEALTTATATLVELLGDENAAVRARAATVIFDQALKLREHTDLAARVADLEAALAAQEQEPAA